MDKESEVGIGIDISGYSEKKTDLAINKKISGGQTIKQFNRGTASNAAHVYSKKPKKIGLIFEEK